MCKCCLQCLESCYWHLIEEKFCFDENIALYQEPTRKEEKNNNIFDNMAFYDSVSVIAGRAIVTIDPPPISSEEKPVIQQPRKLRWQEENRSLKRSLSKSVPIIFEEKLVEEGESHESLNDEIDAPISTPSETSVSTTNIPEKSQTLQVEDQEARTRKKSLRERRKSKSLYLKIDLHREVPIIRQSSMPKFYLDTPDESQAECSLYKYPSTVLTSPVATNPCGSDFDLYSVVQMEKCKSFTSCSPPVPVHKDASSRYNLIKDRIKLKKSKSTLSSSNLASSGNAMYSQIKDGIRLKKSKSTLNSSNIPESESNHI